MTGNSLVLFGDSILDNAPYTRGEPDSTEHLRRLLAGWTVERRAMDGARMSDIPLQIAAHGAHASAAVLTVGGNDAVEHIHILEPRQTNSTEVLRALLQIADDFEARYESAARLVATKADRTVLCTIYEVQLEPQPYAQLARVPLALLNDRIIRTAARLGLDVLELRSVCTEPEDFVMQIEPSALGAEKIAAAIAALFQGESPPPFARVFSA